MPFFYPIVLYVCYHYNRSVHKIQRTSGSLLPDIAYRIRMSKAAVFFHSVVLELIRILAKCSFYSLHIY